MKVQDYSKLGWKCLPRLWRCLISAFLVLFSWNPQLVVKCLSCKHSSQLLGVGVLKSWEEPNQSPSAKKISMTSSIDFYKKLALDCSGQQLAVDLSLLSGQYSDLVSLDCISWYSAGSAYRDTLLGRLALRQSWRFGAPKVFVFMLCIGNFFCSVNRLNAFA